MGCTTDVTEMGGTWEEGCVDLSLREEGLGLGWGCVCGVKDGVGGFL